MSRNILISNSQIVNEEQCHQLPWLHTENTINNRYSDDDRKANSLHWRWS
ncbi:hypothetical protein H6G90_30265 [Nostoc sp. FACHB-145]|nr:hypothetical protein [Nostoc sp. FACHB-145]